MTKLSDQIKAWLTTDHVARDLDEPNVSSMIRGTSTEQRLEKQRRDEVELAQRQRPTSTDVKSAITAALTRPHTRITKARR